MNARLGAIARLALIALLAVHVAHQPAAAEPYLAVQKGLKCAMCHVSPSGGGKRTAYGNVFAQTELTERTLDFGKLWTGELTDWLAVGANARGGWSQIDVPGQPKISDTELDEILAYVEIRPIARYLTLYVDAKLRPDDPFVREQYVRLSTADGGWYIKGGKFFLPYGLRLQDDDAFIRQVTGINFNTPDAGWQLGLERGKWSAQLAVTRGTAGGPEVDSGKQYSLRVSHITNKWRVGGSFNYNDSKFGDRQMQNIFGGLRTGRVAWLAELNYIIDDGTPTGQRNSLVSLLEANVMLKKGHNLKLTFEYFDPDNDVSQDEQTRSSIVWEYFPIQFIQTRLGYRKYDGIPQNPAQNREELFLELHLAF
jgi:hypothetical protein